jgi:pimeloyl-ACP methyl ester carboxylesterase
MGAARLPLTTRTLEQGPPLSYRAFVPGRRSEQPPLVIVHGNSRRATRQFRAFLPGAIARGVALIAPTFPSDRYSGYQSLAGADGALAAREALLGTLEDASRHLALETDVVDLVGYSGGAQFVHRFAMHSPGRVGRAVLAAAGWYTYLDAARPYPHGIAPSPHSNGRHVDVDAFLRIPMHVVVGERDVERTDGLRTGPSVDRRQGPNRLTRALRWMDHMEDTAQRRNLPPQVSFDLLVDTGHSFDEAAEWGLLVERTFDFLHRPDPIRVASVPDALA